MRFSVARLMVAVMLGIMAFARESGAFVIADGRIVLWNRAAEKLLGYNAREVVGRPCCEIFVGRDDDGNRLCYRGCHVMSLIQLRELVHSFDMQTRTKAGHPIWINVSTLTSPDGMTTHLFRDVTETKELLRLVQERLAGPPAPADGTAGLTRRELGSREAARLEPFRQRLGRRRIQDLLDHLQLDEVVARADGAQGGERVVERGVRRELRHAVARVGAKNAGSFKRVLASTPACSRMGYAIEQICELMRFKSEIRSRCSDEVSMLSIV